MRLAGGGERRVTGGIDYPDLRRPISPESVEIALRRLADGDNSSCPFSSFFKLTTVSASEVMGIQVWTSPKRQVEHGGDE
jgi:hypothetical protein